MSSVNPKDLILKLLLAAEGEPLGARDAVLACELFGIRENNARVALVRLAATGLIEAAGRGTYRLGSQAVGLANDISTWRNAEARVQTWHDGWIAVYCGALGRSNRAALGKRSRALQLLGFRELEHELFIRPDNLSGGVSTVRDRLYALGMDISAAVFLINHFDAERDTRARLLWDGKALNQNYRKTREKLEIWLAHAQELELETAARESFLLGDAAIRLMVFDPLLPTPLVDIAERRACADAVLRFDQAGHSIWRRLYLCPKINEAAPSATASMLN